MIEYTDREIQCVDCPTKFTLSAQAQKFFTEQGLNIPKRCPTCRDRSRARHEAKGKPQHQKKEHKKRKPSAPVAYESPIGPKAESTIDPTDIGPEGEKIWRF